MADTTSTTTSTVKPAVTPVAPAVSMASAPVKKSEEQELHEKISKTIREHGGLESNIPHNHPYWAWLNQFRTLVNKKRG